MEINKLVETEIEKILYNFYLNNKSNKTLIDGKDYFDRIIKRFRYRQEKLERYKNEIIFGTTDGLLLLKNGIGICCATVEDTDAREAQFNEFRVTPFDYINQLTFERFITGLFSGYYYRLGFLGTRWCAPLKRFHYEETILSRNKFDVELYEKLKIFINGCIPIINNIVQLEKEKEDQLQRQKLIDQENNLQASKKSVLKELDQNDDGQIDLVDINFNTFFSKNQKRIIEIDKNYIHQFVKVSNFIKTKKQNTQKIFETIRDSSNEGQLEERSNLLKNQIHSYELLVFHSINMIGALISEDFISFYEIYESFDKLGMFNSNWENEVSNKLTTIGNKLDDLLYAIYEMEQNIVSQLSHLSYITQESFTELNKSVTKQLEGVQSSINVNNLLTGIQAYQLYKINNNTKGLR